ncbi:DgyrCDS14156 [Dimorphilus gyrociliatus]|uniref:DgyrCDS14156 n=1 Tax=Dimorphilus gyrociliatus TaxID=2664684 RepID=A0A7I8WCR9_9ANNE|nr:DgyrCDS14156 [Dimorphilus gyrociliatus]
MFNKEEYGSLSEKRGTEASKRIDEELFQLYEIIANIGYLSNGYYTVTFGELFREYETISNKLNGLLVRARKRDMVKFEGEVLFERKDDNVVIKLEEFKLKRLKDISQEASLNFDSE